VLTHTLWTTTTNIDIHVLMILPSQTNYLYLPVYSKQPSLFTGVVSLPTRVGFESRPVYLWATVHSAALTALVCGG